MMLERDTQSRDDAAARLGRERRRLYLVGVVVSLAAPGVPYLTGTWESLWYGLAALPAPLVVRIAVFLLGLHLVLACISLPLSFYSGYVVGHAFGLSHQTRRAWLLDWLKSAALATLIGSLIASLFLLVVVQTGAHWWWTFGLAISALGVLFAVITPYVLVPLFFKMRPLEDHATVDRIQALVSRAGAPVREVCSLDFSRRTAEANAAVIGLGRSRRVVLADTLLAEFEPAQVDAVVAHEIGHHVNRDVQQLLLGNAVLIWIGLFVASRVEAAGLPVLSLPSLAYVPGYPMLLCVVELFYVLMSPLLNWWSRRLEARADRFALTLTGDPSAFIGAMRRLAAQNLVEMCPPRWAEIVLGTHPALGRRIAMAQLWSGS